MPLSDPLSDDVVMAEVGGGYLAGGAADRAQSAGADGCGDDRTARTGDARTDPDGEAGVCNARTDVGGVGAGDGGDVGSMDGVAEEPPGELTEPAAGLVRRLLTGHTKTRAARVTPSLATRTGPRTCTWRCRRRSPGR